MKSKAGIGLAAARILQRRLNRKHYYRNRRDRKISIDLLGRNYVHGSLSYCLVAYNPERHTIRMRLIAGTGNPFIEMETDTFWKLIKRGELHEPW